MTPLVVERQEQRFTCDVSSGILPAIEKCLDNTLGVCFLLDSDRRVIGRVTLDDLRRAVVDGAAWDGPAPLRRLARPLARPVGTPGDGEWSQSGDAVSAVIDREGRFAGVAIDRRRQFVQVAKPDLSHHEFRALLDAFISSWISSKGAYIHSFEQEFATFVGVTHGIATSNGTAALHLALTALGIGPGDEVIVPDLTFAATINAVIYCGATPVIVDIDPVTWGLSVEIVAKALTDRTRAIVPVHLYGRPLEIGPLAEFARSHRISIVEDCAEAHGARYDRRHVGQFSDIACFSFYANKIVTTGEGGICVTDSKELASELLVLRDHGMDPRRAYWHERVGYNYRMTNLQAAIGLSQLQRIEGTLARNQRLALRYRERLDGLPGVTFPPALPKLAEPVVWLACALVPEDRRDRVIEIAGRAGVEIRPFFHSLSSMPVYREYAHSCPNSFALSARGLNLPTSSAVDEQVIDRIVRIFEDGLR